MAHAAFNPDDTAIGGAARAFPSTRASVLHQLAGTDHAARALAFDTVVASYWKPVYAYLRRRWGFGNDAAKDLTQGFFARALEKNLLARYDDQRAAFRTYVRLCVDAFVANECEASHRLKRGGGHIVHSLESDVAASVAAHQARPHEDPDAVFQREWARALFAQALAALETACRNAGQRTRFALLQRYDLWDPSRGPRPTYEQLARELGLTSFQVTNGLAAARRQLRALVLDRLRAVTATDEEFEEEARALLGEKRP